ncbi:hypothetical protein GCM10023172_32250 [Hymenobacter ginsengisoli]|uniref:Uncharacterized protein n=2 Tax=Hymenobacter ginsengisoli TaxID=1051626 RepID=A0ABP8QQB4_9BACT|nr:MULTISPECIES: hypothetical protein [unclassified Hymenobacter]
MQAEKYPVWLASKVLTTSFDWKKATKASMCDLLAVITLHDSYWYNTYFEDANSWILVIKLDAFWNKVFCHNLEDWPFLIIKLQNVFCSFQEFSENDNDYRVIGSAESILINNARLKEWLSFGQVSGLLLPDASAKAIEAKSVYRTEISTVYGGSLSLVHAPSIEILLYSEQGSQLAINLSGK